MSEIAQRTPAPPLADPGDPAEAVEAIRLSLVRCADVLLRHARHFVLRAHLAQGQMAQELAQEILQDLVVAAMQSAPRLDLRRSIPSWLMGILANLLKQRRDEIYRQRRRTYDRPGSAQEDASFFDWVAAQAGHFTPGPEAALCGAQEVEDLLARLDPGDREVLELGLILDLDGQELAERLGIAPGAARQRLRRAKVRLHAAWLERKGGAR